MMKKLFALLLCLALLATITLSVAAEASSTVTFVFETVEEADYVEIEMHLVEKMTMIGALEIQFDYDETYLEIVPHPNPTHIDNFYFECPFTYEKDGILYASNEQNMKYALASAEGIQKDGLFLTLCFRVIRDIPDGEWAKVSGTVTLITDIDQNSYRQVELLTGGVLGTDFQPKNHLHDKQITGIEAITTGNDSVNDGEFVTRLYGTDGQSVVYNIGFQDGEQELQPDNKVVIRIPMPENFDPEKTKVYHHQGNTKTEMPFIIHEDYLTLETDGFSQYSVQDPTKEAGEFVEAPALAAGDINGNGQIEAADALGVLKNVVGKEQFTPDQTNAADVSGNREVEAEDALLILKRVVIKIDKFPVEA